MRDSARGRSRGGRRRGGGFRRRHAGGLYALPGPSLASNGQGGEASPDERTHESDQNRGLVTLLRSGFGETRTPIAVSPRAAEDDWACVPEGLATAALATRGRPFLDGALWGYTPSFLTDGENTFVDFGDEHEGRRCRALTAAATVALSAAAGLGGGAATVVAARGSRRAAVPPKRPTDARVGASGARVEDSVEDSVAEDSGVVAGKKKRGARGKKRGSRGGAGVAPGRTAFRRREEETSCARVKTNARTTTNLA